MEKQPRIVYDTIDFNIGVGQQAFNESKDLRNGKCVGVKLIDYAPATGRTGGILVSVQSSDTTELVGRTDYRDYASGNGGYKESFKPCSFETKAQIRLSINAENAIAGTDFSGQMVFMIETCD